MTKSTPTRVASLCTGIGGLELGLSMAGVDYETVVVADVDRWASAWLAERFPDTPNMGNMWRVPDVKIDLVTAGFPCQPFSQTGLQNGVNDDRYLFDDIIRYCECLGLPDLFLENVPGLLAANRGHAMQRIACALANRGYRFTWGVLAASDVGTCHQRKRWFCYATTAPDVAGEERIRVQDPELESELEGDGYYTAPGGLEFWAEYAPAIRRWERVMGRRAPHPVTGEWASPAFYEWFMGFPAGWVTAPVSNVAHSIRLLGNAVVPHQAAHALPQLVNRLFTTTREGVG